ncbi:hypothetical protein RF11_00479 [Thelohanellus kitauei]|uniref:Uncharacterized protein n=1 Tax=Thelohanellus kitauei TaxID=669202 RepID=A0A0C2MZU4_THEKT|nr:hypothetical protein RF11_00479 [Thelohanellus kitauei]
MHLDINELLELILGFLHDTPSLQIHTILGLLVHFSEYSNCRKTYSEVPTTTLNCIYRWLAQMPVSAFLDDDSQPDPCKTESLRHIPNSQVMSNLSRNQNV